MTAADLLEGKTGYANDKKVTGTLKQKQYSDFVREATAIPENVASGKVFYNNGGKQTGTLEIVADSLFNDIKAIVVPALKAGTVVGKKDMKVGDYIELSYSDGSGSYNKISYIQALKYSGSISDFDYYSVDITGYKIVGIKIGEESFLLHEKSSLQNHLTNYLLVNGTKYPVDAGSQSWTVSMAAVKVGNMLHAILHSLSGNSFYSVTTISDMPSMTVFIEKE